MRPYRYPDNCQPLDIQEQIRQRYEEELLREWQAEPTEDQAGVELYPESAIIRIGDGMPSEEFQQEAKARIAACCIIHGPAKKKPLAKFNQHSEEHPPYPS